MKSPLLQGLAIVAIPVLAVSCYFVGYQRGQHKPHWWISGPAMYLTNGNYRVSFYGSSNRFSSVNIPSEIEWKTNQDNLVEKWCSYGYGQGVTNGVVEAVSLINDLLTRTAMGQKPTYKGITNAIFGSISNAMSKNIYEYFDSNLTNPPGSNSNWIGGRAHISPFQTHRERLK